MKNVTYLLGAGASGQCMPVVSDMNKRMNVFWSFMKKNTADEMAVLAIQKDWLGRRSGIPAYYSAKNLVDCMTWLIEKESEHYSIDTLARKLTIQEEFQSLKRLKAGLICFFLFEQMRKPDLDFGLTSGLEKSSESDQKTLNEVHNRIDKRYDAFFSSTLEKAKGENLLGKAPLFNYYLNESINVISWNYDTQFELSLKEFLKADIFEVVKRATLLSEKGEGEPAKPSLIKLNGSIISEQFRYALLKAELKGVDGVDLVTFVDRNSVTLENKETFNKIYAALIESEVNFFNFAWECERENDIRIKAAKEIFKKSDCVVSIGYSYPYYNMAIDKMLFRELPEGATIYVQDIPGRFETLKSRLLYFIDKEEVIKDVKQHDLFFLPPEFLGSNPRLPYAL